MVIRALGDPAPDLADQVWWGAGSADYYWSWDRHQGRGHWWDITDAHHGIVIYEGTSSYSWDEAQRLVPETPRPIWAREELAVEEGL